MIKNIKLSLTDLLGLDYIQAVCRAREALTNEDYEALMAIAKEQVDFFPNSCEANQNRLIKLVGKKLTEGYNNLENGAPTDSYRAAQNNAAAPLNGEGCFRLGEDGRLYFAGKSEHYHIPLGHNFPGYHLIDNAKKIGISNATHNNTRGYITRILEKRLIACANGLELSDPALEAVLEENKPGRLNKVINLETGSLACEAAIKMMLYRFYSLDGSPSKYSDRIPVFLVMGDNAGGITGGYHGTTVLAQTLRGLWPGFYEKAEKNQLYKIVPVPINDIDAFCEIIETYNKAPYKTAGFLHEIIMMNYAGIRLQESYLQAAYELCHNSDTPILCDEIQSCAWYDSLFLFKKYNLNPDFVTVGKGFPGGNYPASKILTSGTYDSLNQFGALVTNGQEELASLSYLITMEFIEANSDHISETGSYYNNKIMELTRKYPNLCIGTEGDHHMTSLIFSEVDKVVQFCHILNHEYCIDISAQTYKPNCPPVALTKLPLITTFEIVDLIIQKMDDSLLQLLQ